MTLHPPNISRAAPQPASKRLIIEAAIRYRIFELLETGAKSLAELCALTHTAPRGLRAILNALVGLDLLATDGQERYALTDRGGAFSLDEIGAWLRDAGFDQVRTLDAPGLPALLILAAKPET